MEKTIIKQIGFGTGKGEEVEVLTRKEIEKIIDELGPNEAFQIAYRNWQYGMEPAYCAINLENGKVFGYHMARNTSNHACDNNYVDLLTIGQYDEIEKDDVEYIEAEFDYNISDRLDEFYNQD
jgi:hypothetical protein